MRSEDELLDIVRRRAAELRRGRRITKAVGAMSLVAVVGVGLLVMEPGADQADDLVAGPRASQDASTGLPPGEAEPGSVLGRLEIPAVDVDVIAVHGVSRADLALGPGLFPESPMPGHRGNSAIAGFRTTFGAPFLRLDELRPGDPIVIETSEGRFTYEVREVIVVEPTQIEVLGSTFWVDRWGTSPSSMLTLTTEHPAFSNAQRLVVGAELIGDPIDGDAPHADDPPSPGSELAPPPG